MDFKKTKISKQSLDGIVWLQARNIKPRKKIIVCVDGIRRPVPLAKRDFLSSPKRSRLSGWLSRYTYWFRKVSYARLPVFLTIFLILAAFITGAWASWQTRQTTAEEILEVPNITHYYIPLPEGPKSLGPIETVSNEVLFNLPLQQLEAYLNNVMKTPEMKEAEILAARKAKLKEFLKERRSPLVETTDTIAEQKHWKLILAIAFAESTLGKNCADNNCSNIGVKPGHPYWRKYASLKEWVIDFNRLLEKKYKDWTLEEMNGVYVKPKNPNWLLATRQIFTQLQEQGLE
jgi:hypothetical protein